MSSRTAWKNAQAASMSFRSATSTQLCIASMATPQSNVTRSFSAAQNRPIVEPPPLNDF